MKKEPLLIYNLFPLLYGNIANWYRPAGTARDMGFNTLYINPVFQSGFSGSLYSIKDYFDIDKRFADEGSGSKNRAKLKAFIDFAHENGMKVVFDIVLNHTAIDCPLIAEHPQWYAMKNGKVQHPGAFERDKWIEWGDLAQLDNRNSSDKEGLYFYWQSFLDSCLDMGFDGFRADAAYQVPTDLWKILISLAKKRNPGTLFIAETLGCEIDDSIEIANCGFTHNFNSIRYWDYREPWPLEQLYQSLIFLKDSSTVSFPESHDTDRLFREVNGDMNQIKAKILLCAFWSSGFMIPSGFEYGCRKRLDVVKTSPQDTENNGVDITGFIKAVTGMKKSCRILREDSYVETIPLYNSGDVLALLKISRERDERCLLLLNRNFLEYQKVWFRDIFDAFKIKGNLTDISADYRMDSIPQEFEYNLMPGQVKLILLEGRGGVMKRKKED